MKPKKSLMRDKKAQAGAINALILGAIVVLLGVIIFVNVYHALPKTGPSITNESWVFDDADSGTYTKTLANANLIEGSVKLYNSTWTGVEDTDYNVTYATGTVMNITNTMKTGTFGVDYRYEETNLVAAKVSVRTIFMSAIGLVAIGLLVLGALFILAVVSRLRGGGGE